MRKFLRRVIFSRMFTNVLVLLSIAWGIGMFALTIHALSRLASLH